MVQGPDSDHRRVPRDAGGLMSAVRRVRDPRATLRVVPRAVGPGLVVASDPAPGFAAGRVVLTPAVTTGAGPTPQKEQVVALPGAVQRCP